MVPYAPERPDVLIVCQTHDQVGKDWAWYADRLVEHLQDSGVPVHYLKGDVASPNAIKTAMVEWMSDTTVTKLAFFFTHGNRSQLVLRMVPEELAMTRDDVEEKAAGLHVSAFACGTGSDLPDSLGSMAISLGCRSWMGFDIDDAYQLSAPEQDEDFRCCLFEYVDALLDPTTTVENATHGILVPSIEDLRSKYLDYADRTDIDLVERDKFRDGADLLALMIDNLRLYTITDDQTVQRNNRLSEKTVVICKHPEPTRGRVTVKVICVEALTASGFAVADIVSADGSPIRLSNGESFEADELPAAYVLDKPEDVEAWIDVNATVRLYDLLGHPIGTKPVTAKVLLSTELKKIEATGPAPEAPPVAGAACDDSPLASLAVGDDRDARVYYIDTRGHVRELAGMEIEWQGRDLTTETRAEPAALDGAMTATGVGHNGDPRVYYIDRRAHVSELAWYGGAWHHRDLTAEAAPEVVTDGAITSMTVGPDSDPRVFHLDQRGHVNELAWYGGAWHHRDLTADTGADRARYGGHLVSIGVGGSSDPRVFFLDWRDHVRELAWYGGAWHDRDLTVHTGASRADSRSSITAVAVGGNRDPRVYHLDEQGHIVELRWTGTDWTSADLTAELGGQAARTGSALAATGAGPNADPRVFYLDDRSHLRALVWHANVWHRRDVTADLGIARPAASTELTAAPTGPAASAQVFYTDDSNQVHQEYRV